MSRKKETILIALGGNALIQKGQIGTAEEQLENLRVAIQQIANLSQEYRLIITHGNGPQVGTLLLQQECCDVGPKFPLEILVAQTQGQIGYMIESTLDSALMDLGIDSHQPFLTLITYVVVDSNDPGFKDPTKPIGPAFTEEQAQKLTYPTKKTAKGYRRVVASPEPLTIVQNREIKRLIESDFIVICCGGGGIPVVREKKAFKGVDAVIDKDLASAKLAEEVGVDIFVIASDVPAASVNFNTPEQKDLGQITISEVKKHIGDDQFPKGSMGPKVDACVRFVENKGKRAIITSIETIEDAIKGKTGTQIVND